MYEAKAPRSFWIFLTRCWPVQVSGHLVGGGCSDKSPQVTWPPPQLWIPDFQTCPLPIFYRWEVFETIKLGMLAVILIQSQTGLKTQMCARQQLCKLLPLQKFGIAHLELYCGVCVIFFWINTFLKNSQIGLSSDRVMSVPRTAT